MFRSGHDCTSTSSARSPRYCCLQADIAIWVLWKVRVNTLLTRTRFHFCSRLHWLFMRRTGSFLILRRRVAPWFCRTTFIDQIFSELCSQSGKSCKRSRYTSSRPSFLFLFSVSINLYYKFLHNSSPVLPLLSSTKFSVYLLTSNTESCDEDDDEVGEDEVEELVDKAGTTDGTQFDIMQ